MGLIHLDVSTLTGKIIPIVIEEDGATIQKVKETLKEAEGIASDYICLITEGKICMNKESIKYYGIRNNSQLNVILPIRDGSFNPEARMWGINPRPADSTSPMFNHWRDNPNP